jgi:hypothetical protein
MRAEIIRNNRAPMPETRTPPIALTVAALTLACALAGCARSRDVSHERIVHVALTEYRIRPQSMRTRAGRLTLVVHNYGRRTHDLELSLDGNSAGGTKPLPPGAHEKVVVYLVPGHYRMASTILTDQALGQYGTLDVK